MIHKHQHAYGENNFSFETFETYITEFTNFSTSWKASVDSTEVNVSATCQHSFVISYMYPLLHTSNLSDEFQKYNCTGNKSEDSKCCYTSASERASDLHY
jgi:hypothetical protein